MTLRTKGEQKAYLDGYEMCADCIEKYLTDEGKQKLECLLTAVRNAVEIEDIKPKLGNWIIHEKPHGIRYLECPYCNIWYLNEHLIRNSYCPNCGARMVEEQKRSDKE